MRSSEIAEVLAASERLIASGDAGEAVRVLTEANRAAANPAFEVRLVHARQRAFSVAPGGTASGSWPDEVANTFGDTTGIPEVAARDLDAGALAAALQHHGALLVRGLLEPAVAAALLAEFRLAFAAAERSAAGARVSETAPWYVPFEPGEGFDFGWIDRHFSRNLGAVLAVEAPRSLFHVVEAMRGCGVGQVIADYVGEWPALSAKKTSLRRARPDSPTEWHQDGAFLGDGIRTVNVWTALTRCGSRAPGVDVFARRFGEIVATGTDDALFDWSVSPEQATRLGTVDVIRPEFDAGDALLFDQMTLHRTGISPEMTEERFALESWFFAPSTYPLEQVPIAF